MRTTCSTPLISTHYLRRIAARIALPTLIAINLSALLPSAASSQTCSIFFHGASDYSTDVSVALGCARSWLTAHPGDVATIQFGPGEFDVHPIVIDGLPAGSLIFRGSGPGATTLLFDQFNKAGILVTSSKNVSFEDLHLTRKGLNSDHPEYYNSTPPQPYVPDIYTSQGTVSAVRSATECESQDPCIDIKVDDGFPPVNWFFQLDEQNHEITLLRFGGDNLDPHLLPNSDKVNLLKDRVDWIPSSGEFTVYALNNFVPLVAGDRVALKAKLGAPTLQIVSCDGCSVRNVRFTRASGRAIAILGNSNYIVVDRVSVDRAAPIHGKVPFFSGPGGGIFVESGSNGPKITNSTVVGTADDGIAIFSDDKTDHGAHLMQGAVIRNNLVRDNQARGILITPSRNGEVSDNVLLRNSSPGILLKSEELAVAGGPPTVWVSDWKVWRNTLVQQWTNPAIELDAACGTSCDPIVFSRIDVSSNRFLEAVNQAAVISLARTEDSTILRNKFLSLTPDEPLDSTIPLIDMLASGSITVSSNIFAGSSVPRPTTGVLPRQLTTVLLASIAGEDGFIAESGQDKNVGGSKGGAGTGYNSLRLGDTATNAQLKSIVSFDTSVLPADATLISARLQLSRAAGFSATGPILWGGPCRIEVADSSGFSGDPALQRSDFEALAAASVANPEMAFVGYLVPTPTHPGQLASEAFVNSDLSLLNRTGKTQLRLSFMVDDNNDGISEFEGFYSGGATNPQLRPSLFVTYLP